MKKIITSTALVTLFAAPGFAGGFETAQPEPVIQPAPVIAPAFSGADWSGGYVGAQLSYGDTSGNGDVDGNGVVNALDDGLLSANGAIGGLRAGYLYDYGSWVVGGELALNGSNLDFDGGNGSLDALHQLKIKGGYDMGRTLIYGTVGAAYADGSFMGNDISETGYLVGVGLDYMATETVSIGGEVTYNRFDDVNGGGYDLGVTTVGANVAYHF